MTATARTPTARNEEKEKLSVRACQTCGCRVGVRNRYCHACRVKRKSSYGNKWYHTSGYRGSDRHLAHRQVQQLHDNEAAIAEPCLLCGSLDNVHAHHADYELREDTVPICASCHGKMHHGAIGTDEVVEAIRQEAIRDKHEHEWLVNDDNLYWTMVRISRVRFRKTTGRQSLADKFRLRLWRAMESA